MKKKNYALVASFLMMLVATLTSCEKFALDETSTDPHDANANVTFHVSMGKNQSTEFNTKAAGFNTQLSGFNTKATDSNAIPLEKVCSRLSLGIFDEIGKVKTLNTLSTDKGYGNLSVSLDEGEYRVVIIGHNGAGNCTISSPEKIKFSNNKLTDTFYYYGRLNITSEETEETIELKRAVAQFKVHITDSVIPTNARSIRFYYLGGSSTLDATSGYGCVKSRQTEVFKLAKDQRDYSVYTFPHEDSQGLNMKISILDADGKTIRELDKDNIEVKCNYITKANISIAESSGDTPGGGDGKDEDDKGDGGFNIQFNPEWEGEITVEFE